MVAGDEQAVQVVRGRSGHTVARGRPGGRQGASLELQLPFSCSGAAEREGVRKRRGDESSGES